MFIMGLRPRSRIGHWASTENWAVRGRVNGNECFNPRIQWAKCIWEDGPMRNVSSNTINTYQIHVLTIMITFQESPVIKMYIMNVQGWWDLRNTLGKDATTATTFLAAFMLRRPLNSVALATTTHREIRKGVWWDMHSSEGLNDQQV